MDKTSKTKIVNIQNELQNAINELEAISRELYSYFDGIGTERCSSVIEEAAKDCKKTKKKLINITN